ARPRAPAIAASAAAAPGSQSPQARQAELLLARRFGLGRGVPQSYANAGAWLAGKGRTDEPLERWDYSIGYAYTIVAELLGGVRYPPRATDQPVEASFVVEIDALRPTEVAVRMTSAETPNGLDAALAEAFRARLAQTLPWLARPDPRLVVAARITVPVSIRYRTATDVAVFEGEQLLR
ncbi:MAG: hypothetical protein JO090_06480, partial [Rhizobacter sp.]|nr:hypothetical protein [Rhizobacter sp.]